jgi:hypothetical protein
MPFHISVGLNMCQVLWDVLIQTKSLLGAVERQLVMNLLWLELPIQTSTMSSWVTKEGKA